MAVPDETAPTLSLSSALPLLREHKQTPTTQAQAATVQACLPYLNGAGKGQVHNEYGIPILNRSDHELFLREAIEDAPHVAFDSQRPWLVYWNLAALQLLGCDVSCYEDRYVTFFLFVYERVASAAN